MKVLLLQPPEARRGYASGVLLPEPLGALYLASALKGRHDVRFVDLRLQRSLRRALGGFVPDAAVVGTAPVLHRSLDRVLPELRRIAPGVRIVLAPELIYGFTFVGERPRRYLHPIADALAVGTYLATRRRVIPRVLEAWENGSSLRDVAGLELPEGSTAPEPDRIASAGVPDREILGRARGRYIFGGIGRTAFLLYTFGCAFQCRFCPMSKHDGSMWVRPLEETLDEIAAMTEPNVFLQDYGPFQAPEAMAALAEGILRRGLRKSFFLMTRADSALRHPDLLHLWRRAGLRWLYMGLDGHSPERLREIRKGTTPAVNERALRLCESMGLGVAVGFTVSPDFTGDDFARLRDYVGALRPPLVDFTVETPIGGTRWFDEVEGRLTTADESLFDLNHAVLPTALPLRDFYREMTRLHWLAGRISMPAMLKHYPWRDVGRNLLRGPGALWRSWRAARDHA